MSALVNLAHEAQSIRPVALGQVITEMLAAKTLANRRPAYLRRLASYLTMFARGWEGTPIRDIGRHHLEDWFKSRDESPGSRNTGMLNLSVLFEFAIRCDYCEVNPVKKLERVRVDRSPPRILTPKEARTMLNYVRRNLPWRLPQVVLGLYAGIRPAELSRLTWDKINMDRGYVTIDVATAKTRRRRIVHLDPKCVAWLRRCKRSVRNTHRLGTPVSRKWIGAIERNCGIEWVPDILRHSAASYLIAKHNDAGKVARMLGNSPTVLENFYVELVDPATCRRFWKCPPMKLNPF